ncbi:MAG: magnesium transporter CorA family protein [Opitutales bacterium]|nr:magnesium transporter CorA family protein [Opitutales bacterium]
MLKTFDIVEGKIIEAETGAIDAYVAPTEEEKRHLIDEYQIDPHSLNSALDPDEISRVEFEDNHIAIILNQPRNYTAEDLLGFGVTSVGIFLFSDKIIIVQPEDTPLFEYGRGSLRARSLKGVMLRILHHATNHFLEHLKIIRLISSRIEKDIEFSVSNHHLTEMFVLSKSLTYYESATNGNKVLLAKLVRDTEKIGFTEAESELLEDIIVENNQCVRMTEIYTNILVGMSDARGSIVGNNLAVLMKQLAIINIIFLPLNVIVGLGGMSEFTMMTEGVWWGHTYSAMTLLLVLLAYGTYYFLKKASLSREEEDI